MKSYISALKAVLKEYEIDLQEDTYLIKSLTRACKLQNDKIKTRLPIKKSQLAEILSKISETYHDQPYLSLMYRTLFSTMYFGLLRISEVTGPVHAVKVPDVKVGSNKKKFLLILQTSKTHWKNVKPQMIKISAKGKAYECYSGGEDAKKLPCPYQLLREYSRMRRPYKSRSEPFFVHADNSPVTNAQVTKCLKTMLKLTNYDETLFGSHSIRIGRTCDLYKLGIPIDVIKKLGRWKSNAVYWYLRY